MTTPAGHVAFISYSHRDKPTAEALAQGLSQRDIRVWIDGGELRAGDSIIERISTAIAEVDFVIALVSESSVESSWCRKELSLAITGGLGREGVRVLPLRLGAVEMPASLGDLFYLQVDPEAPETVLEQLALDIRSHRQEAKAEHRSSSRSGEGQRPASSRSATPQSMVHAGPIKIVEVDRATATPSHASRGRSSSRALPRPSNNATSGTNEAKKPSRPTSAMAASRRVKKQPKRPGGSRLPGALQHMLPLVLVVLVFGMLGILGEAIGNPGGETLEDIFWVTLSIIGGIVGIALVGALISRLSDRG
jgi:hypothetical protein